MKRIFEKLAVWYLNKCGWHIRFTDKNSFCLGMTRTKAEKYVPDDTCIVFGENGKMYASGKCPTS